MGALHLLQQDLRVELLGLFTVMNQKYNRVSMHATRLEMLQRQAEAVGLPIETISLPDPCTNEQCDAVMRNFVTESATKGVHNVWHSEIYFLRTFGSENEVWMILEGRKKRVDPIILSAYP